MRPRDAFSLAGLALLSAAIFGSARHMDFVGDDVLILERIRAYGGLANPLAYFHLGFFSYYRPVVFLSHAFDWQLWGLNPAGYHLTNVLLHTVNAGLVLLIARRLLSTTGAFLAAVLFLVHASNHEAVFWISGRFDLMATLWTLAGLLIMTSPGPLPCAIGLAAFALGLLSKESALAFPLIVAGYDVFIRRLGTPELLRRLSGIALLMIAYAWLRWQLAGLDPAGGISRIPKAVALALGVLVLVRVAQVGFASLSTRRRMQPRTVWLTLALVAAGLLVTSLLPATASFVREKFSFAAFAVFYLLSPLVTPVPDSLFPGFTPWAAGFVAVTFLAIIIVACREHLLGDGRLAWLLVFTIAALIPVSSMTEGQRYLYLGSIPVALLGGLLATEAPDRWRRPVWLIIFILAIVSGWQISRKAQDWIWAGQMTRDAIRMVDGDLAPRCGEGHVVLLTAPVGVRGVYTHLYRESFSLPRGCTPRSFTTVVRVVEYDSAIRAYRDGSAIVIRASPYQDNFVLSPDFRHFSVPLRETRTANITTPLGVVGAYQDGPAEVVRLDLRSGGDVSFYYYGGGQLHRLGAKSDAPPVPPEPRDLK